MKNDDLDGSGFMMSTAAAVNPPKLPNGPEYEVPSLPLELDNPLWWAPVSIPLEGFREWGFDVLKEGIPLAEVRLGSWGVR